MMWEDGFADGVDNNSGGNITGVAAGTRLSGGGVSGSVTLNVDVPLTLSGNNFKQAIIRGTNTDATMPGVYGQNSSSGNSGALGTGTAGVEATSTDWGVYVYSAGEYGGYFFTTGVKGRGVYGETKKSNWHEPKKNSVEQ